MDKDSESKIYSKKCKFEIIILIMMISSLILGFLFDIFFNINIPSNLIVDINKIDNIGGIIFSSQVTISTIIIALAAILGLVIKDNVYGVSVIQFISYTNPYIFKYTRSVFFQLGLIVLSYICFSLDLYNTLICSFLVCIFITAIISKNIFQVFKGEEQLKVKVKDYIIYIFKHEGRYNYTKRIDTLNGIEVNTINAIQQGNTLQMVENLNLCSELLFIITKYNTDDKKNIIEKIEYCLSHIYNKVFEEKNTERVIKALESIENIYKICNKENKKSDNKTYLDIYDSVYYRIFSAIANLILDDREDQDIIIEMQIELYDNMYFVNNKKGVTLKNNVYLNNYSSKIYYEMMRKGFEKYYQDELFYIKKELYRSIKHYTTFIYKDFESEKINQLYRQLCKYVQVLIKYNESKILRQTFFEDLINVYRKDSIEIQYNFIIIIYIYYLIEYENLIENEHKENIKKLVSDNVEIIKKFLLDYKNFKFENEIILSMRDVLRRLEEPSRGSKAKCIVMDGVIDIFILFYTLKRSNEKEKVIEDLKLILDYNRFYVSWIDQDDGNMIERYKNFICLFYNTHITEDEVDKEFNRYKDVIQETYKQYFMKKAKEDNIEFNYIKANILEKLRDININLFENRLDKNINEVKSENVTIEISMNEISNIDEILKGYVIKSLINLSKHNLDTKSYEYENKDILEEILSMVDKLEINIDCIIGYYDKYYKLKSVERFNEFVKDKEKIKSTCCDDCIVLIDSNQYYFQYSDISVTVPEINIEDECKNLKKNNRGEFVYYDTLNCVELTLNKQELKQYLNYTKCNFIINIKIEYGFSVDKIGVGVFLE